MSVKRASVCPPQDKDRKIVDQREILYAKMKSSKHADASSCSTLHFTRYYYKKKCNLIQNTGHHTYKSSTIIKACAGLIPDSMCVSGTAGIMAHCEF